MSIAPLTGKLYFKNLEFDAQFLLTLGKCTLNGADIGECYATAF